MRTVERILLALAVLVVGASLTVMAQSFNPIIEENGVDGLLLGAEGSYKFFSWLEPSLGLAYGLSSQKIRYKAGIGLWHLKVSVLDWPRTPILGRVGQMGLQASLQLEGFFPNVAAFVGEVWESPGEGEAPRLAYLTWGSTRSFTLPFGVKLTIATRSLYGMRLVLSGFIAGEWDPHFQMDRTSLRLDREGLSVSFEYGTLKNPAKLRDFEFVQGVKGDSSVIKGDHFWALQFERSFDLMTLSVPVPLLPQPLGLLVQGAVFAQVSSTRTAPPEQDAISNWQNRLAWGLSVLLSLDKVAAAKARADFVFTRDGQFQFLFGF